MTKYHIHPTIPIIFILLAAILQAGCQKSVILDLADQEGGFLIIEANIMDNNWRQYIRVTHSTSYYDNSTGKGLDDVKVWLEVNEEKFIFKPIKHWSGEGQHYNDSVSSHIKGKETTLFVEYNGTTYTAKSQWKPVPDIDSVTLNVNTASQLDFSNDTLYEVLVHFRELPTPDDYYLINLYINGNIKTWRPSLKVVTSDKNLDEYVSYTVLNLKKEEIEEGDVIQLELRSISKENLEFYNAFLFQTDFSGNPFAGAPPANIPTNISNGARGFFQISSVSTKSIVF